MAIFHLQIEPVTRSTGRTATAAAAYRAGERIRDERTGTLYNHSERDDVQHKEIFLPTRLDRPGAGMEWARDRATLWNAAEKAEQSSNGRVAREYRVALPAELSGEQRLVLARTFAREIADRYNVAVDLAIHAPRPEGDPRNFHAHLLATTREVRPEGLGPKTGIDMEGGVRSELGLPPSRQEFRILRARWAELSNEALRQASVEARIDHRSLAAQGIDRVPTPHFPIAAIAAERRGQRSEVADRIRERYRERIAARQPGADNHAREIGRKETEQREPGLQQQRLPQRRPRELQPQESQPRRDPTPPLDMDARRRQAVQDWLQYRAEQAQQAGPGDSPEHAPPRTLEDIRRRAVEGWKRLQARGAESPSSPAGQRDRDPGRERGEAGQGRDAPGLGDEFSG